MEEALGVKLQPLLMGEELLSHEESSHFLEATIDDHIKVKFLLMKQESKFRIYGQTEFEVSNYDMKYLKPKLFLETASVFLLIKSVPQLLQDLKQNWWS